MKQTNEPPLISDRNFYSLIFLLAAIGAGIGYGYYGTFQQCVFGAALGAIFFIALFVMIHIL